MGRRRAVAKQCWRLLAVLGLAILPAVLQGADSPSCTLKLVEPAESVCAAPEDCEGLPKPACEGEWACLDGACQWQCGEAVVCECPDICQVPKIVDGGCTCVPKCDDSDVWTHDTCDSTTGECSFVWWWKDCDIQECEVEMTGSCSTDPGFSPCAPIECAFCRSYSEDGIPLTMDECVPNPSDPGFPTCNFVYMLGLPDSLSWDDDECVYAASWGGPGGISTVMKDCNDQDPTTNDWCDPETNQCVHEQAPADCFDENPCTWDFEDAQLGCIHEPVDCDDLDACTIDWCDIATGECVHEAISCDDDDPCTINDCHLQTGCRYVLDIDLAKLLDQCSHWWCDHETGEWTSEPIPPECADADLCTEDFVDGAGDCLHVPYSCDDGSPCTNDWCDTGRCYYELVPGCTP